MHRYTFSVTLLRGHIVFLDCIHCAFANAFVRIIQSEVQRIDRSRQRTFLGKRLCRFVAYALFRILQGADERRKIARVIDESPVFIASSYQLCGSLRGFRSPSSDSFLCMCVALAHGVGRAGYGDSLGRVARIAIFSPRLIDCSMEPKTTSTKSAARAHLDRRDRNELTGFFPFSVDVLSAARCPSTSQVWVRARLSTPPNRVRPPRRRQTFDVSSSTSRSTSPKALRL